MKKWNTLIKKHSLSKGFITFAVVAVAFYMTAFVSLAAEGKVIADTAKIRAEANTNSEVVGSTVKGKTIDILDAVKDSSGTVWYKVSITGGGYGYIRSDLVQTSDTIEVSKTETQPQAQAQDTDTNTKKPEATVPTAIGEQQATIKSETSVRIRTGASTSHDAVTSLPNGTAITLIGEAKDSAGNKWYQMTCTYNGKSVEGYVRSDLIAIGAVPPADETASDDNSDGEGTDEGDVPSEEENIDGEDTEEPVQEPEEVHNDYEIRYAQNQETGEYEYYYYDNTNGTRKKLEEILNVVNIATESQQKLEDQAEKNKIIVIILAVVIVILFTIVTILLFKIRSLYYEDYDEDYDEEEVEEEPVPVKKKVKKQVVEEEPVPVKKKRPASTQEGVRAPKRTSYDEPELYAAEKKEPAKKPVARKSQNFLVDDDEFEFDFLNMDEKDS